MTRPAIVTRRWLRQKGQAPRHRRVPGEGADDRGLPRRRLRRRVERRPHPRPARARRRHPGGVQEGEVGAARRRRRARLPAALHRRPGQEEEGRELKKLLKDVGRAPARDGRRPRGRGDRVAPARGAEAEGARPAHGLPRDHARGDRAARSSETREIDERLVDAQETRRILDRLYGYEVSPVLWKKIMRGLSAGRVQSVATRLVVERERERMAFRAAQWWDIEATFDPEHVPGAARLGRRQARRAGPRLRPRRQAARRRRARSSTRTARAGSPRGSTAPSFAVARRRARSRTRAGRAPPFMTSTLQQEASRKLRFSAQTTMRIAQRLYENGYITYMRTDSTTLSESALDRGARAGDASSTAPSTCRTQPRRYERKVKNAQEAHEAIRPSGDRFRTPQELQGELNRDEFALYELIWMRTIASQMKDARGQTVSLRIAATSPTRRDVGVRRVRHGDHVPRLPRRLRGGPRRRRGAADDEERRLPHARRGRRARAASSSSRRATRRPAGALHRGDARPDARGARHRPPVDVRVDPRHDPRPRLRVQAGAARSSRRSSRSRSSTLLEQHFGRLVDYDFTARMEDDLDRIAAGDEQRGRRGCARFYFGDDGDAGPARARHATSARSTRARSTRSTDRRAASSLRVGRYGPYLERGEQRANVPETSRPTS